MLYEKTTNRYKYKFHVNIEKGDFSVFDSYSSDSVFSQYIRTMLHEHTSHTTLKSFMTYFDKNFKKKEIDAALEKWEELKKFNINFDTDFNRGYGFTYDYHSKSENKFKKINMPFTNFTSLATYDFSNKLSKLEDAIISYAIENTDLSKIPPVYIIRETKDPRFLKEYLYALKNNYPDITLGDGTILLEPKVLQDKELYFHFVLKHYQNESSISSDMFNKIINEFSLDQLSLFFKNTKPKFSYFLSNVELYLFNNSHHSQEDCVTIFNLMLDNLKEQDYDFSTQRLADFASLGGYEELFNRFIKLGFDYKRDINYLLFDNNNLQLTQHISNLLKYNLWDLDTPNNDGLTYIEYHQKKINDLPEKERGYASLQFRNNFSRILEVIHSYSKRDSDFKPLTNFDFSEKADDRLKAYIYCNLLKHEIIDEQALTQLFHGDILNGLINFILTSKDKSYYGPSSLLHQDYPEKYYILNEVRHRIFCENLEKLDSKSIIPMLINSIKINSEQDYLQKNYDFYYNFVLNSFLKCIEKKGFNFNIDQFTEINNLFERIDNNSSILQQYNWTNTIIGILQEKSDEYSHAQTGSMYEEESKKIVDLLNVYKYKRIEIEKHMINSSLNHEIPNESINKKRL